MEVREFLRVVNLRQGKWKPAEFKLRESEKGLSLFAHGVLLSPTEVIEAVRAAGKQGDLRAAVVTAQEIRDLGLILVPTRGGTPVAQVNAIHYEARLPFLYKLLLRLQGIRPYDYFNEHVSQRLCGTARMLP